MCGRYAVTLPPEAMAQLFATLNRLDYPPRYNIAPTQPVVAIWQSEGRRQAHLARWGLVPFWVKDPREFPLVINARAESMAEKPAFRDALRNQRCVVPASGYYEWRTAPDGSKQPYYISFRDGEPMALAGLFSIWSGPDGEEVDSLAIVTTRANADLAPVHDRMPAILAPDEIAPWLDTASVDSGRAGALARPFADGRIGFHPVSKRVNSARNEGEDLVAPVSEALAEVPAKPLKRRKKATGQLDLF